MPMSPADVKSRAYTDHAHALSVPTEISVSMVAAPWRRLVHIARWNGAAPHSDDRGGQHQRDPLPPVELGGRHHRQHQDGERQRGGDRHPAAQVGVVELDVVALVAAVRAVAPWSSMPRTLRAGADSTTW